MKNEEQLSTKTLIRNAVSAFRNGYIGAEQASSAIDFAAKLGDTEAQNCSKTDALSRLWLSYSRYVFSNADPYMVANEGAEAIIDYVEGIGELGQVSVSRLSEGDYELRLGRASLYLSETEEGDVFLYFYSPLKKSNRREECRLDLTECGSDDAACFIATVFEAYGSIVDYYYNNKVA